MKKILPIILFTFLNGSVFAGGATVTQKDWRWRNDNDSETSATWVASTNQDISETICTTDGTIRLRFSFAVSTASGSFFNFFNAPGYISYSTSSTGTFTPITSDSSSHHFVLANSPFVNQGQATSEQLFTTGGTSYTAGMILENLVGSLYFSAAPGTTSTTEYEWVIKPTVYVQGQTYYFKLDGLSGYGTLPFITYTDTRTTGSQTVATCDSLISPSGGYTWRTSGIYKDKLKNTVGCDSVITTNLTIQSNTGDTTAVVCNAFTWYGTTYTASATPSHTFINAAGCDSVVTLDLTVNSVSGDTTAVTCTSFPWYGTTYTNSGDYTHTLTAVDGCDSIVTLHLTLNNNTGDTTAAACGNFMWYGTNYSTSATPTHTFTNVAGCDSVVTLHLTITNIDATTSLSGGTITANEAGATYVWLDCTNGNAPVPNETGQSFNPAIDGSYSVEVTKNSCSKTSACVARVTAGLYGSRVNSALKIHPVPNNGSFTVEATSAISVEIYNSLGQLVLSKSVSTGMSSIDMENADNGIYFLASVDAKGNRTVQSFVVTK